MDYEVRYVVDVDADSPEEAAIEAFNMMVSQDSELPVLEVRLVESRDKVIKYQGEVKEIDLTEYNHNTDCIQCMQDTPHVVHDCDLCSVCLAEGPNDGD